MSVECGSSCILLGHPEGLIMENFMGRREQKLIVKYLSSRSPKFTLLFQDLNIGLALWLAAGGDGWLSEVMSSAEGGLCQRVKYKSEARILLVGSGADEQCAGYGRHRTKYRNGR